MNIQDISDFLDLVKNPDKYATGNVVMVLDGGKVMTL